MGGDVGTSLWRLGIREAGMCGAGRLDMRVVVVGADSEHCRG